MAYYSRSSWTSAPKGGVKLAGSGRTMTTIYIHYPGAGGTIGRASTAATRKRLEGYRRQHKIANGWADIAYNVAVDQSGNVWELRGIDRQSGANGGTTSNRHGQAILVLVGNDEAPTPECILGIQDAVRRIRAAHPKATRMRGHQQSPDASTECPGSRLMSLVRSGALEPGKVSTGGTSKPAASKPAVTATGKLVADGRFGTTTVKALQQWLNEKHGAGLAVDGKAGKTTWRALQKALGMKVDGEVSNQSYKPEELGNGITQGWDYDGRGAKGSTMVRALQKLVGGDLQHLRQPHEHRQAQLGIAAFDMAHVYRRDARLLRRLLLGKPSGPADPPDPLPDRIIIHTIAYLI